MVDVVELEFLEGGGKAFFCVLDFGAGDFGRYVELFSRDAGFLDCGAELGFVAVDWWGGVRWNCRAVVFGVGRDYLQRRRDG